MSLRIEARNERKRCLLDIEHLEETTTSLDPRVDDLLGSVDESIFEELGNVLPDLVVRPPAYKKLRVSILPETETSFAVHPQENDAMLDLGDELGLDELMLPDVVVRPSPFDKLTVTVSPKLQKPREWETDLALRVYPELSDLGDDASRLDRLRLVETIDRTAFSEVFPIPHLPPVLH